MIHNNVIQTQKSFLNKFNILDIANAQTEINQKLLDDCVDDIKDKLDVKPPIFLRGCQVIQHRDIGFFSSTSIGYQYSGQIAKSKPLTMNLELLLVLINELFGANFNGILINRYANGSEFIGAHSDDETFLDKSGVVAISYGGSRVFRIRNKHTKQIFQDIPISNLDIIHMGGNFQKEFTHEIPATKKNVGLRYSFTFRHHNV